MNWTRSAHPVLLDEVEGRECLITIEPRPHYCDRGNYIAKIFPRGELAMDMDSSDGWPRYYFDLERAKQLAVLRRIANG